MSRQTVESCARLSVADLICAVGEGKSGLLRRLTCTATYTPATGPFTGEPITMPLRLATAGTPTGGLRLYLICDLMVNGRHCGKRAETLYLPYGAKYFGCRQCYNLSYRSQHEHPSKFMRMLRWQLGHYSVSDYEALDRFVNRRVGGRAGRVSVQAERLRPKRSYHRRRPLPLTPPSGSTLQAFCPRGRDRRQLVLAQLCTFRNGREALRGLCAECGTTTHRIIGVARQ